MELAKRWVRNRNKAMWFLKAPGHAHENRAAILGPFTDGRYKLELWAFETEPTYWETYMWSADLKSLKAIGRIEAARRLHA